MRAETWEYKLMVRRLILRTMVVVGAPATALLFWLANPATWRDDFRASAARMWMGDV